MFRRSNWLIGVYVVSTCMGGSAGATLGESENSIQYDLIAPQSSRVQMRSTPNYAKDYKVQSLEIEGITIREYVSSQHTIFAVAWDGQVEPDLTRLFGIYYSEYADQLKNHPRVRGNRNLLLSNDQLVVAKRGQMRNLHGRAYVPSLVPPGVAIEDIK